jgi:hypothetical protein
MEIPEEWKAYLVARTKEGMARARAAGKQIGRKPTGEATVKAIQRLRSQGFSMDKIARTLGIGKGVSQRVCKEFDTRTKTSELTKPQPEGYLIPGKTDQKWSTTMIEKNNYSEVTYRPDTKRGRLSVYVGLDVATHPEHALTQGMLLKTTITRKPEGLEIRGLVVTKKGTREDGILTVGFQKRSPYNPLRIVKSGCRLNLPPFSCASASHAFDKVTGEHVWMVRNEDIALKTRQPREKTPAPQSPTSNPVWMPPAADIPDACFRAAVDTILKIGQEQNRRYFFMAEDGVTKVWVDGSSLGYEQIKPRTLSSVEMGEWMVDKGAAYLVVELLKSSQGDMSLDLWAEWFVTRKRLDLAKAVLEELKCA